LNEHDYVHMCTVKLCGIFLCKERLVKLVHCITECSIGSLAVACGAQCLLVSPVLTNDILVSSWAKFYVGGFSHYISLSLLGSNGCWNSVPSRCAEEQVYCYCHFINPLTLN